MAALHPKNRNASQTNKPAPRRSRNAKDVGDDVEASRRRVEKLELENTVMREAVEARRKRPRHRAAEHAVGHGRHPVHHGRVQVLAFPGGRLLRRDGGLLDLVALPERRHGEPDAP